MAVKFCDEFGVGPEDEDSYSSSSDDIDCTQRIFKKKKLSNVSAEIKHYFKEAVISHKQLFPNLSRMAQCYLSIPATSAQSERAFSQGRLILSHTRSSLSASRIRAVMCLNNWHKNGNIMFRLFCFHFISLFNTCVFWYHNNQ